MALSHLWNVLLLFSGVMLSIRSLFTTSYTFIYYLHATYTYCLAIHAECSKDKSFGPSLLLK